MNRILILFIFISALNLHLPAYENSENFLNTSFLAPHNQAVNEISLDYLLVKHKWLIKIIKTLRNKTDIKYREQGLVINPEDDLNEKNIRKKIITGRYCSVNPGQFSEGGIEFHTHPALGYLSFFPSEEDLMSWQINKNKTVLISDSHMISFTSVKDNFPFDKYRKIKNPYEKIRYLNRYSEGFTIYSLSGTKPDIIPKEKWNTVARSLRNKKYLYSRFYKIFKYHHSAAKKRTAAYNSLLLDKVESEIDEISSELEDLSDYMTILIWEYDQGMLSFEKFTQKQYKAGFLYNTAESLVLTNAEQFALRSYHKPFLKEDVNSYNFFCDHLEPAIKRAKRLYMEYMKRVRNKTETINKFKIAHCA